MEIHAMMRRIRLIGWLALALLPSTPAAHPQGRTGVSAQAKSRHHGS
jgi:hypothetical protein